MAGTIEIINNNIINKMHIIKNLINLIKMHDISFNKKIEFLITEIHNNYHIDHINLFVEYFEFFDKYKQINYFSNSSIDLKKKYNDKKDEYLKDYIANLDKNNIISKINEVFNILINDLYIELDKIQHLNSKIYNNFSKLIKMYKNIKIEENVGKINFEICSNCHNKMKYSDNKSELYCVNCGNIFILYGNYIEDNFIYNDSYLKTKNTGYDPSKHCRFWIERIQAKESIEIPKKVIEKVKHCFLRDGLKKKEHITCKIIRTYLRELTLSEFNEHVPLIKKILSGKSPPQLTSAEVQLINIYFSRVIKIFEIIKPPNKVNCPYHPYFIYKILDQILVNKKDRIRKKEILANIHLQSRDTLIENDKIWKKICSHIKIFKYKPTNIIY